MINILPSVFPVVSARALRAETTFLDLFYIRSTGAFIRIVGDKTAMSALYGKKREGKTDREAITEIIVSVPLNRSSSIICRIHNAGGRAARKIFHFLS